jgi:hypothetical protein
MTALPVSQHRILRCVAGLKHELDEVSDAQAIYLTAPEKAQTLQDLARLESRLAALRLRLLACADDVADQAGARDVGAWLAHQARLDWGPARRDGELATALEERWHRLRAALGTGALNLAQARVCVQVLGELPEDLEESLVDAVEEQLVILAEQWAPRDLLVLGRKILQAIDPETADAHEARKLQDEERRARERTSLHAKRLGDGITGSARTCPTRSRTGCSPTSTRSPTPATRAKRVSSRRCPPPTPAGRATSNAGTRSPRCSNTSTRTRSPPRVGMRPR